MNEQIKALAQQAGESIPEFHFGDWNIPNEFIQKFAELIVRECANILDPNGEFTEKYKTAHTPGPNGLRTPLSPEQYFGMLAAEKLKKNFGVEE